MRNTSITRTRLSSLMKIKARNNLLWIYALLIDKTALGIGDGSSIIIILMVACTAKMAKTEFPTVIVLTVKYIAGRARAEL